MVDVLGELGEPRGAATKPQQKPPAPVVGYISRVGGLWATRGRSPQRRPDQRPETRAWAGGHWLDYAPTPQDSKPSAQPESSGKYIGKVTAPRQEDLAIGTGIPVDALG